MKKLNTLMIAASIALGLSVATIASAQPRGDMGRTAPTDRYECPYGDGMGCYGDGYGRGHGMRGHRGGERNMGRHHRGDMNGPGYDGRRGQGMGYGMRGGFGSYMPHDYTVSLITPAELENYRVELRSATTKDACQKVDTAHRKLVEERAASMKVTAPQARIDVCVEMEKDGWFSR